jgi:hypothetical protein
MAPHTKKRRLKDTSHTFIISSDAANLPSHPSSDNPIAVIDRVSADYRRTLPQEHKMRLPMPPPLTLFDDFSMLDGEESTIAPDTSTLPVTMGFLMDPMTERKKHCSSVSKVAPVQLIDLIYHDQDDELREWQDYRAEYLYELLYLEGYRGFNKQQCMLCPADSDADSSLQGQPLYRCRDCFIGQPVCKSCCLSAHSQQPLHVIEVSHFSQVFSHTNIT